MNERFQNALKGIAQKTPPVWFMRQAGRYHDHYQGLKKKHSFVELCKTPDLAAQVALGPMEAFDFDVSILFSDILFPLEALGMGLEYSPGPKLSFQVNESNIDSLKDPSEAIKELSFQAEAVKLTRSLLPDDKSLIGFVGGPWTLFTYAVEGRHDGNMIPSKKSLNLVSKFNNFLLPVLEKSIQSQLENGAEVVMIFDTSSGNLSPQVFSQYVMPALKVLTEKFPSQLGYYSKACSFDLIKQVQGLAFAGLGMDHRFFLPDVLEKNKTGFIQGNFDQSLLFLKPDEFEKALRQYLKPYQNLTEQQRKGWVCGLGHGVLPETPPENVKRFVQIIREAF